MFEAIERMIEAREKNLPITPQMAADARAELDSYRTQSRLLKRLRMSAERARIKLE